MRDRRSANLAGSLRETVRPATTAPRHVANPVTCLAVATLLGFFAGQAQAGPPLNDPAARGEAARAIPFDRLDLETQHKLGSVINNTSIYRRMPIEVIDSDPDMYLFLIRHPEVMVNIWELMGISNVVIRRIGPYSFDASDGHGTSAKIDLIYGDRDTHVMFAEGAYDGALLRRKLTGRCVMVLKSGYQQAAAGRTVVTNRLDVFLQLDNAGVEMVAKTLYPFMGKTADTNFAESTKFISQVSLAAEHNGPGVEQLAAKLTKVSPEVRDRFARVVASVNHRAILRTTEAMPTHGELVNSASPAAPAIQVRDGAVELHESEREYPGPSLTPRPGPMLRR